MRKICFFSDYTWCRPYKATKMIKEKEKENCDYIFEFIKGFNPTLEEIEKVVELYFI